MNFLPIMSVDQQGRFNLISAAIWKALRKVIAEGKGITF